VTQEIPTMCGGSDCFLYQAKVLGRPDLKMMWVTESVGRLSTYGRKRISTGAEYQSISVSNSASSPAATSFSLIHR
jgi:hypothetical protein